MGIVISLVAVAAPQASEVQLRAWRTAVGDGAWHEESCVEIGRGARQSLAVRSDGTLIAFGDDQHGQCSAVPALPVGTSYVTAGGGERHALALRSDGALVGWGATDEGQTSVPSLPAGLTYVDFATALAHGLALRSDGTVVAFGTNDLGEGNVPALPAGTSYTAVACGGLISQGPEPSSDPFSLVLRSDGEIFAFGSNSSGQTSVPTLPGGVTYVALSAGGAHSLALRSDGLVVAFGDNSYGQCDVPALPAGLSYVELAAGREHSLVLRSDGALLAFGSDGDGRATVPALPAGMTWLALEAGDAHSIALRSDGRVVTFGDNAWLQCNVPALPAGRTVLELARGKDFTLARLDDGTLLHFGSSASHVRNVPALPPGLTCVEVVAGSTHAAARLSDGSVVAWGLASNGETVVPELAPGVVYVELSASPRQTLARRSDGSVVAFDGTPDGAEVAPALPAGLTYVEIACGGLGSVFPQKFAAARRSDGAVLVWGDVAGTLPVPAGGAAYLELGASTRTVLARRSDGDTLTWPTPICPLPPPPAGQSIRELAEGAVLALRSDGVLVDCNGELAPALPAGQAYGAFASGQFHVAAYGPSTPTSAPTITALWPPRVEALSPGTQRTVTLEGRGLDLASAVWLDGAPLPAARVELVSPALLRLDLPQVSALGPHTLAVVEATSSSEIELEVVAATGPRLELGTGDPENVVDRDDGLRVVLAGPVGSVQRLYGSASSTPSQNAWVHFALGNQFTELLRGPALTIPAAGWVELLVPTSALPDPGPSGMILYAQSLQLVFPPPVPVSTLGSIRLVR